MAIYGYNMTILESINGQLGGGGVQGWESEWGGWEGFLYVVELKNPGFPFQFVLKDIDSIFEIFKFLLDQSQGFPARVFSIFRFLRL